MDEVEFEALRRRFGDDMETWPAPYRQAALGRSRSGSDDPVFDALLRDAVAMPTDEAALSRALAARIATERQPRRFAIDLSGWMNPVAVGACAATVLALASLSGYALAPSSDDRLDIAALRMAAGGGIADELGLDFGDDAL